MLADPARSGDPNFPPNLAIAPSHARQQANNDGDDDGSLMFQLLKPSCCSTAKTRVRTPATARQDIAGFGIAGRTWEAAYLLRDYLVPSNALPPDSNPTLFDPPCPLFDSANGGRAPPVGNASREPTRRQTIVELGSGTGFLSLAIAPALRRRTRRQRTTLIMTDLDNVCPLLEDNLARAHQRWSRNVEQEPAAIGSTDCGFPNLTGLPALDVLVRPLPWGDLTSLLRLVETERLEPDIILASDLIYFEFLYGPLLRTLIALTEPRHSFEATRGIQAPTPTVIFSYKVRSLTREEPFWRAFGTRSQVLGLAPMYCPWLKLLVDPRHAGRWFELDPVQIGRKHRRPQPDSPAAPNQNQQPEADHDNKKEEEEEEIVWTRYGSEMDVSNEGSSGTAPIGDKDDELYVFVCRRHASTLGALGSAHGSEDRQPSLLFEDVTDDELLLGLGAAAGHSAGAGRFEEILLANLEWD